MLKTRLFALVAVLMLVVSALSVSAQDGTIVEVAAGNEDFSTLVSLVEAAGLVDTLNGEGPFTVFAPTNEAFAELPQVVLDYLAANPDVLTQVLTYHVIDGAVTSDQITESMAVASLDMGNELDVNVNDMGVMVNNATVVMPDVAASNGVIHAIDTVLLPPFALPEVDPEAAVAGTVVTAGSSTVYPISLRIADLFRDDFGGEATVDSIGSGGGFERFCREASSQISNASDPIWERPEEIEACEANGRELIEFVVAQDPLAVAISQENDFVDSLTLEQLAAAFSGAATTWADLNPDWPAEDIQLFSPGSDSGTYSFFISHVLGGDEASLQNTSAQFSEDDNVLVQGILGSPNAIGYFGFAYFLENTDTLRVIPIDGVDPSDPQGQDYALNRPLFLYTAPSVVQEFPQAGAFLNYYLQNAGEILLGGSSPEPIGYNPVSDYTMRLNVLKWYAATGTSMGM